MDEATIAWALVLILVGLFNLMVALYQLAFRELKKRYEAMKVTTGTFKVIMPSAEWQEAVQRGAFALSVKDTRTGEVVFTCMVSKETE